MHRMQEVLSRWAVSGLFVQRNGALRRHAMHQLLQHSIVPSGAYVLRGHRNVQQLQQVAPHLGQAVQAMPEMPCRLLGESSMHAILQQAVCEVQRVRGGRQHWNLPGQGVQQACRHKLHKLLPLQASGGEVRFFCFDPRQICFSTLPSQHPSSMSQTLAGLLWKVAPPDSVIVNFTQIFSSTL